MPADPEAVTRWFLAGARLSALLAVMPVPGFGRLGLAARVWFGLILGLAVLPLVPAVPAPANLPGFVVALAREVFLGLTMGWLLGFGLGVYRQAASLVGFQAGYTLIQTIDQSGEVVNPLEQLYALAAGAVILATNAHHQAVIALAQWLRLIPPGADPLGEPSPIRLAQVLTGVVGLALRLALPVVGGLLVVDLALGILVRTAPQLNLLGVGFPLKVGLGLALIAVSAPLVFGQVPAVLNGIIEAADYFWRGPS
mgnify:CR=1 FL=1